MGHFMELNDRLADVNRLLFCEQCHRRALDFIEAALSAVCLAGDEDAAALRNQVEGSLEAFLSLHEACLSRKEG
jgi:hypothetical protein